MIHKSAANFNLPHARGVVEVLSWNGAGFNCRLHSATHLLGVTGISNGPSGKDASLNTLPIHGELKR